jgi:polyphosphate kinase 2 (PPK2 family)
MTVVNPPRDLREYIEFLRDSGYTVRDGHTPDPDLIDPQGNPVYTWQEGYPYPDLMDRDAYELEKYRLQVELLKFQYWLEDNDKRAIVLFEGRDAAGKGGTIKRFTEHLNPRTSRVVALSKPSDRERGSPESKPVGAPYGATGIES